MFLSLQTNHVLKRDVKLRFKNIKIIGNHLTLLYIKWNIKSYNSSLEIIKKKLK